MSHWFRWMLAAVLAVALPVQGVVAATMALCGPQQPVAAAAVEHAHHADHAEHDHAGHGAGAAQAEPHQCGACSVCAAAHGLASSPVAFAPMPRTEVHPDAPVPGIEPFISGAPERPPRLHLA